MTSLEVKRTAFLISRGKFYQSLITLIICYGFHSDLIKENDIAIKNCMLSFECVSLTMNSLLFLHALLIFYLVLKF